VITAVNRRAVYTVKSFVEDLEAQQGGIMLEGKYAGDPFSIMPLVCKKSYLDIIPPQHRMANLILKEQI
jgi:hypothetical protein